MLFHALNWHKPIENKHRFFIIPLLPRAVHSYLVLWQHTDARHCHCDIIFTNCSCITKLANIWWSECQSRILIACHPVFTLRHGRKLDYQTGNLNLVFVVAENVLQLPDGPNIYSDCKINQAFIQGIFLLKKCKYGFDDITQNSSWYPTWNCITLREIFRRHLK